MHSERNSPLLKDTTVGRGRGGARNSFCPPRRGGGSRAYRVRFVLIFPVGLSHPEEAVGE